MKKILGTSLFVIFLMSGSYAQTDSIVFPEVDKSPMDMSYWPANYPILKMSGKAKDQPIARVIYGRPLKNGRSIFGGIIKYNDIWRMGANEATEIEFFNNVKIAGKPVAKGLCGHAMNQCTDHELPRLAKGSDHSKWNGGNQTTL